MSYVDLGQYLFKTGPDFTGQNTGFLTSYLDLAPISVPYFEMYRLVISTANIPGAIPTIVQTTSASTLSSVTTLNMTFGKATTTTNTLAVFTGVNASGTTPSQSACTIGGSADHFGNIPAATSNNGFQNVSTWICPATTQASTAIVCSFTGGTGNGALYGYAYEISGLSSTVTASAAVDVAGTATSAGANSKNITTGSGSTTSANDFFIGFQSEFNATGNPQMSTATTTPPLTNLAQIAGSPGSGDYFSDLSSWGLVQSAQTNVMYNAISTIAGNFTAAMVALLPSTAAGTPAAIPFKVARDGRLWDQQSTVAGVGYTYNETQVLHLNQGNTLQIFWPGLASSQYASYAPQIQATAWFRYDPSIQKRS